MAGLVPAIPIHETQRVRQFYVYILASRPGGAIYVGVTNDLIRRVYQHRAGMVDGHTKRYGIDRLVHYEIYEAAYQAIQREKNIKHWPRAWKTRLIGKETIRGGTCMTRFCDLGIGIAGTSPAMTAVRVASVVGP